MSGTTAVPAVTTAPPRPWRLRAGQWVWVAVVFGGIGLAIASYSLLNWPPASMRWPGYFATDPATGALLQPDTGDGAYQTLVLKTWLDDHVPYVPVLVFPYLSFLVLVPLVVPLLSIAIGSFRRFLSVGLALITSLLVLDIAYYLFPSSVVRDVTPDTQLPGRILSHLWANDAPFNSFPSWACAWATVAIVSLWRLRNRMPVIAWVLMAWLALVLPASVMIRQNYLVDAYAGVIVGFAAYWACMFLIERPRLVPRAEAALVRDWRDWAHGPDADFDALATEAVRPGPWGDEGTLIPARPVAVAAVLAAEEPTQDLAPVDPVVPEPMVEPVAWASVTPIVEEPPVSGAVVEEPPVSGAVVEEPPASDPFVAGPVIEPEAIEPEALEPADLEPADVEPADVEPADDAEVIELPVPSGDRAAAILAYNRCWELLDLQDRTAEQDAELLSSAYTSRERWLAVGDPQSSIVAEWMISRAAAATGKPDIAVQYARRALVALGREDQPAWLRASVYEGLARAYAANHDRVRRQEWVGRAERALAEEQDEGDRRLIADQIASIPPA